MRPALIAAAFGLCLVVLPVSNGIAAPFMSSEVAATSGVELVRRCPPGYRRTIGGCVKKRPSWWSLLLGL